MPEIKNDLLFETGFTLRYRGNEKTGFSSTARVVVDSRRAILTVMRGPQRDTPATVTVQHVEHEHVPGMDRPDRYHLIGEPRAITSQEARASLEELYTRAYDQNSPQETRVALLVASMGVSEAANRQDLQILPSDMAML